MKKAPEEYFTDREFVAILEWIHSEMEALIESQNLLIEKMDRMLERFSRLEASSLK